MNSMKSRLLSTTVIPLAIAAGFSLVTVAEAPQAVAGHHAKGCYPCAAKRGCNPCAAKRGCYPCAAKRGCNPCAARGCNPCAAKRGCNPCAAKRGCNPCAAKRGCNPCAARGCNPCAARGCNPCGANPCNPCNPCAGGAASFSSKCIVPRLASANPCAAKRGCNPCAAKRGCNPCAAKRGCNPCGANPCGANPCGPCGAAPAVELTKGETVAVYKCLQAEMKTAYAKSGKLWAKWYAHWKKFSNQPYVSSTHGSRFVHNFASKKAAAAYGKFEKVGKMTRGGILAKDSFTVTPQGRVSVGPLFLMEKMKAGFNKASGDWRYTLIMPNGQTVGTTNGKGSKNVKFCITCHAAVAQEQDAMFFLPEEFRVN